MSTTTDPNPSIGDSNSESDDLVRFDNYYAVNKAAAAKYHDGLVALIYEKPAHPVSRYVRQRGLTLEDIEYWQLGFAPPAYRYLADSLENVDRQLIPIGLEAGLLAKRDRGVCDFFYDRLLFPIHDHRGYIVGFTGRLLTENKKQSKYFNTAQNPIFRKEEILYGWHRAYKEIKRKRHCTLTEGNTDVIALHRANIRDAVGKGGTALTEHQLERLKKECDSITLIYDLDPNGTGQKTLKKDMDRLLRAGLRVKVFKLGDDNATVKADADSWVRRYERPTREFAVVDNPKEAWPYDGRSWQAPEFTLREDYDLTDVLRQGSEEAIMMIAEELLKATKTEDQVEGINQIVELLAEVRDVNYREVYIKQISKKHTYSLRSLTKQVADRRGKARGEAEITEPSLPDWISEPSEFFRLGYWPRLVKENARLTGYYFRQGNNVSSTPMTNFILEPLYHVVDENNTRRLVKVTNGFREKVIELTAQMLMSSQNFEMSLSDAGSYYTHEEFERKHLKRIVNEIMDKTPDVYPIKVLGYQSEGFFAFSNAVYNSHLVEYNEHGVVKVGDRNFFSPALSPVFANYRQGADSYKHDRYLAYCPPIVSYKEWSRMLLAVYGERAMMGMLFVIAALFKDIIIRSHKIPILYCYGPPESGKSTYAESLMFLFFSGKDSAGNMIKPLNFAAAPTKSAFWATMSRFRNCPMVFNEFDENALDDEFKTAFKAAWDNESRQRMSKDGGGKMDVQEVNCCPILVGQYLADSDDGSVVSRSMVFEFQDRKEQAFTPEEIGKRDALRKLEQQGLSGTLTELLQHRELFEKEFEKTAAQVATELYRDLEQRELRARSRTLQNMTCMLTIYDLLAPKLDFPMTRSELWDYSRRLIGEMNNLLHESDALNGFWSMVAYLFYRGDLEDKWDFRIDTRTSIKLKAGSGKTEERTFETPTNLLFIRTTNLHKPYAEYSRKTSKQEPLKESTLLVYLKQQSYYVGQVGSYYFSNRAGKGFATSALVLNYDMLSERTGISLQSIDEGDDERERKTIQGRVIGEVDSIPMGGSELWTFRLEYAETKGDMTLDHFRTQCDVPAKVFEKGDLEKLRTGSRWEITGLWEEKPWGDRQVGGIKRRIFAESIRYLDPVVLPGSAPQYLGNAAPTDDAPF